MPKDGKDKFYVGLRKTLTEFSTSSEIAELRQGNEGNGLDQKMAVPILRKGNNNTSRRGKSKALYPLTNLPTASVQTQRHSLAELDSPGRSITDQSQGRVVNGVHRLISRAREPVRSGGGSTVESPETDTVPDYLAIAAEKGYVDRLPRGWSRSIRRVQKGAVLPRILPGYLLNSLPSSPGAGQRDQPEVEKRKPRLVDGQPGLLAPGRGIALDGWP